MPGLISAIALFIKELTLLVFYVKNNAFPQPLTEEEKHLRLMAEGNQFSRNLLMIPFGSNCEPKDRHFEKKCRISLHSTKFLKGLIMLQ